MEELETPPEGAIPEPDSPESATTEGPSPEASSAGEPGAPELPQATDAPGPDEGNPPELTAATDDVPAEPASPPAADEVSEVALAELEAPVPGDSPQAIPVPGQDGGADSVEAVPPTPPGPEEAPVTEAAELQPSVSMDELLGTAEPAPEPSAVTVEDTQLRAVLEAIVYVAEEPLTLAQLAIALQQPASRIKDLMELLVAEFDKPEHGVTIREVAGGYKMATKPEHHDAVRSFVKSLKPPLKLSLPALETLAVIAYKQPVTSPEIMEIRGVRGAGVLNTLLDRKLIAAAGRKNVIGKPILYKTTKEFLIQFGLKDLSELPSLKEFEEIRRMAFAESEVETAAPEPPAAETAEAAPAPDAPQPEAQAAPEPETGPESQES